MYLKRQARVKDGKEHHYHSLAEKVPCAALQQGLIQAVRDFCDHANALCTECRFSEVVRRTLPRGGMS